MEYDGFQKFKVSTEALNYCRNGCESYQLDYI